MHRVPLTQGLFAQVSKVDYERVQAYKWCASREGRQGKKFYAIRWQTINGKQTKIRMHRFILDLPPGYLTPDVLVDHLDGDGLNNQRSNLEVVTFSENMRRAKGWGNKKVEEPCL